MVTLEKVQRGAAKYIDAEILPKLQGKDKWVVTAASTIFLAKLPSLLQSFNSNAMVQAMGIIGSDGTIDLETLVASVKPAARQTPAKINIPFGGEVTLTESDLDTLYSYINQA